MTRINTVSVQDLETKFLLAEYRELPRVSGLVWSWYDKTYIQGIDSFVLPAIPSKYTLGKGHVKFFYDKGEWLRKRFEEQIVLELKKRGINVQFDKYRMHPRNLNKDWTPDQESIIINQKRIDERRTAIQSSRGLA